MVENRTDGGLLLLTCPTVLLHPAAKPPTAANEFAAGHDICCVAGTEGLDARLPFFNAMAWDWLSMEKTGYIDLLPGASFLFRTGFAQAIPYGYCCIVEARSGLGAMKVVDKHAGVIDPDYRGEWFIRLVNHNANEVVRINVGDKIAQGVYQERIAIKCPIVTELPTTARGAAGFGSTDSQ